MRKVRLSIDLIPRTCWGHNLRKVIPNSAWEGIRKRHLVGNCSVCGELLENNYYELHELWEFNRKKGLQKLIDLMPLCKLCHSVKHFGRSEAIGESTLVREHLSKINQWDSYRTERYIKTCYDEWEKNSKCIYNLDIQYALKFIPRDKATLCMDKLKPFRGAVDVGKWAKKLLKSQALIIDTETTGLLKSKKSEIIQIAIINMKGKVLYYKTIKPMFSIPREASNIHHIYNNDVKKLPSFSDIYEEVKCLTSNRILLAYNSQFDSGIFDQTCSLYNLPNLSAKWECVYKAFKAYNGFRSQPLPGSSHDALGDCKQVLKIMKIMAAQR